MIPDSDMKVIEPATPPSISSSAHVAFGVPIPKPVRVRNFSPDEWEEFVQEWATSLFGKYAKVRRFGGAGDLGVDIAGFESEQGFEGVWDNYQCKRYDYPLRPSDIWVEVGKVIYYSHIGKYTPPRNHYFVASSDIGTSLEQLLNKPTELHSKLKENWDGHCKDKITTTVTIDLSGDLLAFVDSFDFSIFSSRSAVEVIEAHSLTGFHAVRFGGGLPARPKPENPPETPTPIESRYVRQLLDAYGDHIGSAVSNHAALSSHEALERDFLRQRERFYHAEALRNFARDTVPPETFSDLQNEIYQGVIDIAEGDFPDGFERMKATVSHSTKVAVTANPLASVTKTQDRQGICHQLANEDQLTWVPDDDN